MSHRAFITALSLTALSTSVAQTTSMADSVMKLNRAGLWELAGPLAQRSLGSATSPDERCGILVGGAYAAARVSRVDAARATLRTFDAECANSPVARRQASDIATIREAASVSELPKTGVELGALDQFWSVIDLLRRDGEPSQEQWRALFTTPTYRMVVTQNGNFRTHLLLAFKPSRRAERDSIVNAKAAGAATIGHLERAFAARDEINAIRATLERTLADSVAIAVRSAARFLPPGATDGKPVPFVALGVYTYDGYAQNNGIILDALFVRDNGLTKLLSHEFHHMYTSGLSRISRPTATPSESALLGVFVSLRNEGIADLVDKPYPLPSKGAGMAAYTQSYNDAYARTPAVLHSIDSLFAIAAEDSTKFQATAQAARAILPYNAHPNGAYLARTVYETFGVDSLFPALENPFALIRVFRAAEAKRGHAPPFSAASLALINDFERRFIPK